ncbi:hypothetical protein HAX54_011260 [Datura stramonium]|uniref:OTU domain-containing protein n=1 Tax=Datura stramonium TaxID=4076 RepID=A0ABS8Y1V4_DATST|nr:hypothetical protein [Datura stramonium]
MFLNIPRDISIPYTGELISIGLTSSISKGASSALSISCMVDIGEELYSRPAFSLERDFASPNSETPVLIVMFFRTLSIVRWLVIHFHCAELAAVSLHVFSKLAITLSRRLQKKNHLNCWKLSFKDYNFVSTFKSHVRVLTRSEVQELDWARMPISVYMYDQEASGLISIAEYGQEYGKDNPIKVLYHGFGHYDALHIPGKKGPRSKL